MSLFDLCTKLVATAITAYYGQQESPQNYAGENEKLLPVTNFFLNDCNMGSPDIPGKMKNLITVALRGYNAT